MEPFITEIQCEKLLAPSSINLGDFVINPYRGCSFGCLYCYAQKNKAILKRKKEWGSFVDVKINALDRLRSELDGKKIERILIGSTTEVYQPLEEKYTLTRNILALLNKEKIAYTILTKSPLIMRDLELLKKGTDVEVYFTVNPMPESLRVLFEPQALPFEPRKRIIKQLSDAGVKVTAYINPLIPYVCNTEFVMHEFKDITNYLAFESVNVQMIHWEMLRSHVQTAVPGEYKEIDKIFNTKELWENYWEQLKKKIAEDNEHYRYSIRTFFHGFSSFFEKVTY
jgi:DNA repair photolyase